MTVHEPASGLERGREPGSTADRRWGAAAIWGLSLLLGCPSGAPEPTAICEGQEPRRVAGVDLVLLCPATFEMGCTAGQQGCQAQELPAHDVTLSRGLWMGRTEVTQAEFLALMAYNPSDFSACGAGCPVEQVSWHEAAAFTNAMSASEGLTACYACEGEGPSVRCAPDGEPVECAGYRLPTEAEWEFAARAGEDFVYSGSNDIDEVAWWAGTSGEPTRQVATKQANAWGLHDMSGNVWEWLNDWHDPLGGWGPALDPRGPDEGDARMTRGGSVYLTAPFARVTYRIGLFPEHIAPHAGFRVARTFDGSPHPGTLGPEVGGDWPDPGEWCSNGLDDDGDGDVDCHDPDCAADALCAGEFDCLDGRDDEGDGAVDCDDPDCDRRLICRHETACDDGIDNDGNGDIDCLDPICWADPACPSEPEDCSNGRDDDHDFLLDCADAGCAADPACAGR